MLNAADEEAVRLFLARKIRFIEMMPLVREVLAAHTPMAAAPLTLDAIGTADAWARAQLVDRAGARSAR